MGFDTVLERRHGGGHGMDMDMGAMAWFPEAPTFQTGREATCGEKTPAQCAYYQQPWHDWYVADLTFAQPTVAFFCAGIAIFVVAYTLTQLLALSTRPTLSSWRRVVATTRYLSYRGYRIKALGWNSAPIGILLLGLVGAIFFFCMDLIPQPYYWPGPSSIWGNSPPLGTRSGWMALGCMPFVFATASKANWITLVTGVPHEKLQVFHRWIAYAFFVLALMHTFPFIVWHIANHDMVEQFTKSNLFIYWTGVVALIVQAWLTVASFGPLRRLSYEFFKAAHFIGVIIFIIVFFWHCGGILTSWDYFVATAAVYVPCWAYPWLRTIFEYGIGQKAQVFVEESGFVRVTITTNAKWNPGQHCFLRFHSFGLHALSSHPFTICSLPSISANGHNEMTFYLRHRRGLTAKLHNYALEQPGVQVPVLVDGPYGGIDNYKFFDNDRLLVVAGGSGAGWILPFAEQFLRYCSSVASKEQLSSTKGEEGQVVHRPRSLRIILATREVATCRWFQSTLNELSAQYDLHDTTSDLSIEIHLTGEAERLASVTTESLRLQAVSSHTSSSDEEKGYDRTIVRDAQIPPEFALGRPNLPVIIRDEAAVAANANRSMACFVCGPLTMQNDVRNAVAKENLGIMRDPRAGGIYLHVEHFSWA